MVEKKTAIEKLEDLLNRTAVFLDPSRGPEFLRWRSEFEATARNIFPNENSYLDRINPIFNPPQVQGTDEGPSQNNDALASRTRMLSADAVISSMIDEVRTYWREDELVPIAHAAQAAAIADSASVQPMADPRTVFVVHGRNEAARKSMFDFLRAIGLKPLEWSQAVSATGEATPYIGQILDTAFSIAQAVVVLMTPDDEAWLRKEFQTEHDAEYEKQPTGQARPNVLFEAGMAMGRHPRRTVLVEMGTLRPFSDVGGRHVLRLNNSSTRRQELAERLRTAGCAVELSGTDWHTVGSFDVALAKDVAPKSGETASRVDGTSGMLLLEEGVCWEYQNGEKRDGPFCQVCFDRDVKAIHLQNGSDRAGGYRWFCLGCHNGFGSDDPGMMTGWSG